VSDDYPIYFETAQEGIMSVRMEPCKPDGSLISEEEDGPYDDVEEPNDLLGKRLDLLVCINHARGINKAFSSEVSVSFELSRCANPNSEDGAFRVRLPCRRPSPPPLAAAPRRRPAPRARREDPTRRGALSGRWRQTGVISGTSNPTFNFKQQVCALRRGARGGAEG